MAYAKRVTVVYIDGGPGLLCYIIGTDGPTYVELPEGLTNNHCEYKALIHALNDPRITSLSSVDFLADSRLVVEQMKRKLGLDTGWQNRLHEHLIKSMNIAARIINGKLLIFTITWVPREENLAGIALEKELERRRKTRVGG